MVKVKGRVDCPSQIVNSAKKKTDRWADIRNFFSSIWNKVFSSSTSKPANLPPVKKVSLFNEVSSTLSKIKEVVDGINAPVKKPETITNPPSKKPAPPPSHYKVVNPFFLKGHYNTAISIVHGDMISGDTEVIVNAANVDLRGGGGIDGAIHKAGGDAYKEAHQVKLKAENPTFKEGDALIIKDVLLNKKDTKDVIVVAGPTGSDYQKNKVDANKKLYNCYRNALQLAHDQGKKSIAFPSISTGIFGYPKDEAAKQSLKAINDFITENSSTQLKTIRIHCYNLGDWSKDLEEWGVYEKAVKDSAEFTLPIQASTPKSFVPDVPKLSPDVPKLTTDQIKQKREDEKVSIKLALKSLSASLAKSLNKDPILKPRPHVNFANTCYMNASLQILKNVHQAISKTSLQELLKKDLSWKEGDTLETMEKRLSSWPIITPEKTLEELEAAQGQYEDAIKADTNLDIKLANMQDLAWINGEIKRIKQDPEQKVLLRNDKLLFKWSFLLYMQACQYGNPDQITDALKAHHRVCFAIGRNDFTSVPGEHTVHENHDSSEYMDLWHEMLGLQINVPSYKAYNLNGADQISHFVESPQSVIYIEQSDSFLTGLANHFSTVAERRPDGIDLPANQILEKRKICDLPPKVLTFRVKATREDPSLKYSKDRGEKAYLGPLDLTQYFNSSILGEEKAIYSITGFSYYTGAHYFSYIYNREDKTWYSCNDLSVAEAKTVPPFEKAITLTYAKVK